MKILFFLVVTANVALFMWEYKTGAFVRNNEISEQYAALDQEQILLVSELKTISQIDTPETVLEQTGEENALTQEDKIEDQSQSSSENASAAEADIPAMVAKSLPAVSESIVKPVLDESLGNASNPSQVEKIAVLCFEVGPFTNKIGYQTLANRVKKVESEIKPISRDEQIASNYMVYYPAAETELASGNNIRMLKSHGIKDLWLLTGADKGMISLGLFIKEENALKMKNELLAKGINAEVKPRYKTKSQQYALIKGDDRLMAQLDSLKETYPELVVKQIPATDQGCW